MPYAVLLRTLALAILVSLLSCSAQRTNVEPPNVLVVLIDSLRADHLGLYGYERATSPNIDSLGEESLVFGKAHAQSPWTKPSIPTLFTSLYPIQHGVYEGEAHARGGGLESDVLADGHTTLAERFRAAGYETFAVVHNAHLEAAHGFAQGFDVYDHGSLEAPEINRRFLDFLDQRPDGPFFAYLHYLDAHWPFQPSTEFQERFTGSILRPIFDRDDWGGLRDRINDGTIALSYEEQQQLVALHDAGIAELDHQLGLLFANLRERNLLENTVLLLTSDHGEELLDHGEVGHGGTLFSEVIEIPFLLRLPGAERTGRVAAEARLIDVVPTLLAAAGLEAATDVEGHDLLGSGTETPELVAETRHKRMYRLSFREGDWKYIRTYIAKRVPGAGSGVDPSAGLQAGLRIKATGLVDDTGTLHASKLRLKDPGDDDLELSGRLIPSTSEPGGFYLHGLRIDGKELLTPKGEPLLPKLKPGDWVKIEGEADPRGILYADKFEPLPLDEREDEFEGIIESLHSGDDGFVRLSLGPVFVRVTKDTRLKGFPTEATPIAIQTAAAVTDPFSPSSLLSAEAPPFEESLFDLETDPSESRDLASLAPERLAELRGELDGWLERMRNRPQIRAERQSLDAETIESLRVLGYVE